MKPVTKVFWMLNALLFLGNSVIYLVYTMNDSLLRKIIHIIVSFAFYPFCIAGILSLLVALIPSQNTYRQRFINYLPIILFLILLFFVGGILSAIASGISI